jgi:hypothetical protein
LTIRISNFIKIAFFGVFLLLAGCKKEESVQSPVNNEPEENTVLLVEPANNGSVNSYIPLLKWDAFGGAAAYDIHVSADANFITPGVLDTNIASTEVNIPPGRLGTGIYYYWKVRADLGSGNYTSYSQTRRFRVILTPPAPPVLLQPLNSSVDQSFLPLFDWEDTPTAETYRIQVSINSSFIPVMLDSSFITGSQLQAPYFFFNTGTNYFWKVNASNSNGMSTGDWSDIFNFRTIDGPQPSSISGRIRFAESNFIEPPFRYIVSAYKSDRWPPGILLPDYNDTLNIQFVNNEFIADYRMVNIINGSYHITVYAQTRSISNDIVHKSVYGCDTARVEFSNCAIVNPGTVIISNGIGLTNINLLSWADSSKSIF